MGRLVAGVRLVRATFDAFYVGDHGPPAANVSTDGLRKDEQELFYYLQENNLRLELEKIPYQYVMTQLNRIN